MPDGDDAFLCNPANHWTTSYSETEAGNLAAFMNIFDSVLCNMGRRGINGELDTSVLGKNGKVFENLETLGFKAMVMWMNAISCVDGFVIRRDFEPLYYHIPMTIAGGGGDALGADGEAPDGVDYTMFNAYWVDAPTQNTTVVVKLTNTQCDSKGMMGSTAVWAISLTYGSLSLLLAFASLYFSIKYKDLFPGNLMWWIIFVEGCLACPLRFVASLGQPIIYRGIYSWPTANIMDFTDQAFSTFASVLVVFLWLRLALFTSVTERFDFIWKALGFGSATIAFAIGMIFPILTASGTQFENHPTGLDLRDVTTVGPFVLFLQQKLTEQRLNLLAWCVIITFFLLFANIVFLCKIQKAAALSSNASATKALKTLFVGLSCRCSVTLV